jgi:hypothetical protein
MALDVIAAQSISVDIRGAGPDQGDSNGQCPGGLESDDVVVFGHSAEWLQGRKHPLTFIRGCPVF